MRRARVYFALQAGAGAAWWIAVALSPLVRRLTLGVLEAPLVAVLDVPLFVVGSALAAAGLRPAAWIATAWTWLVTLGLALIAVVSGTAGWGVLLMTGASVGSGLALALLVLGRLPTEWLLLGPLRPRPARAGGGVAGHLAATLVQIVVFWGLLLGVAPLALGWFERRTGLGLTLPAGHVLLGVVALVLASALGIGAAAAMSTLGDGTPLPGATARRLVVAGPYRWVRNSMAVSGIAQGLSVGVLLTSWTTVAYALAGAAVWNFGVRPHEEADLARRFGDDFARYRAAVRCWIPRRTPFRTNAESGRITSP